MNSVQNECASESSEDVDPCTGFPTTHKAKLSITSIVWNRQQGENSNANGDSENQSPTRSSRNTGRSHWLGLLFTILSALTFSFNALLAKLLSHLHPFNLGVWTFMLMTLFASFLMLYHWTFSRNDSIFSHVRCFSGNNDNENAHSVCVFLFIRSFCGVSALIFFFYAVKYLAVADALVIDASSPIFVYLMAFLFLREKFGFVPILSALLAFCGVTLIARPPFLANEAHYDLGSLIGTFLSFSSMLCIAISIIAIKFLETVHHAIVNFAFGLWGAIQCLLVSWICGVLTIPKDPTDILKILGVALLFYLGQAFITLALQYEDAGPVGLARTTEVMFIFVWQLVFLGVVPDVYSWCGAFLILLGVVLTLIRNWISTLPETSRLRNKCILLLY